MNIKDFRKVNNYLWEIPESFRDDMRVPARIFATDDMLPEIFRDRSVSQLINLTTLPGIQKWALAMPDMHEGYGSPIGGVTGIDIKSGIISPGLVGYDINCLHPDATISLPFGTKLRIKSLSTYNFKNVKLLDKNEKHINEAAFFNLSSREENDCLYYMQSHLGFFIKSTADHPLYDGQKMKRADTFQKDDNIIIYPFSGVEYKESASKELISREKIINALEKFNLTNTGNRYNQIINWLEKRGLLNLRTDSWQIPYLIKILGYLCGDGTMNIVGKDRKAGISFYGKKEDLEILQRDLLAIGIKAQIYKRTRHHAVKNHYNKIYKFVFTEFSLHTNSTAFLTLLYCLGASAGNKTMQEFLVPTWIMESPDWYKRLFLAAFFGAEMSKPNTINKYNFYAPTLNINKAIDLKQNGIKFLNQICMMLGELGISTCEIVEVDGLSNPGKTVGLRFQIASNTHNLINFFQTIGFEYHKEKQYLACLAVAYLKYKEKTTLFRKKIRELVRVMYKQGTSVSTLSQNYGSFYTPTQFIEHSVWCHDEERVEPRIAFNFPSFNEFRKEYSYGKDGFVIDKVESVEKEHYNGLVYDFTVNHLDHNFIANNFVVSNCGVRLLRSELAYDDVKPYLGDLASQIYRDVPSGVGRGGRYKFSSQELDKIFVLGAKHLVDAGQGTEDDLLHTEENGSMTGADPKAVSDHAKARGKDQLGTLGSGNHFLEIQRVDEIFDAQAATTFGLFKDQVTVAIHCGSRGLGHQIATDYIRLMLGKLEFYKIDLPDRELSCAPFASPEGQKYYGAMVSAANFAWANRQMIMCLVRESWTRVLGRAGITRDLSLGLVYDVAHNIGKIEEHKINGKPMKLMVHRKGATRAFPSGHAETPQVYRAIGQPVLIPGTMGTASYVLVGTSEGMELAFGSSCHGAGRRMSRAQAKREVRGPDLRRELEAHGIVVRCDSNAGLAEEAPSAYKDVDQVVNVVHGAGIARKVARLRPIAVIKGG